MCSSLDAVSLHPSLSGCHFWALFSTCLDSCLNYVLGNEMTKLINIISRVKVTSCHPFWSAENNI